MSFPQLKLNSILCTKKISSDVFEVAVLLILTSFAVDCVQVLCMTTDKVCIFPLLGNKTFTSVISKRASFCKLFFQLTFFSRNSEEHKHVLFCIECDRSTHFFPFLLSPFTLYALAGLHNELSYGEGEKGKRNNGYISKCFCLSFRANSRKRKKAIKEFKLKL